MAEDLPWRSSVSRIQAEDVQGEPRRGAAALQGDEHGPGNVQVYVGYSADLPFAVDSILSSKTFDNGTVCASEQAIVVRKVIADLGD